LRRVRRSSADKTSAQIANYWDRTALACWQWDLGHAKIWPPRSAALHAAVAMDVLRLFCYIFAHEFLFNPHFDLESDYVTRKPILHRIQRCILRTEILSTFRTRVDRRSVPWSVRHVAIHINKPEISKNAVNHARNSPIPLRHVDFHLTHECLGPPHSPRLTTARSLYALPHNDATNSDWLQWDAANSPPNCPCPSTITTKI